MGIALQDVCHPEALTEGAPRSTNLAPEDTHPKKQEGGGKRSVPLRGGQSRGNWIRGQVASSSADSSTLRSRMWVCAGLCGWAPMESVLTIAMTCCGPGTPRPVRRGPRAPGPRASTSDTGCVGEGAPDGLRACEYFSRVLC